MASGWQGGERRLVDVGLFLLWLGLLVGSYLPMAEAARTPLRLGSSLTLVLVAARPWYGQRGQPGQGLLLGVAVGMALGCVGDFAMAGLLKWLIRSSVLGGMLFFGLGHLAYVAGIGVAAPWAPRRVGRNWGLAVLAWQGVNLAAWLAFVYPASRHGDLIWPALGYGSLLAGTAGLASGLALAVPRCVPIAVGAALFLFSDLMIAVRLFAEQSWADPLVWATYGPGQMLIVFGAALAVRGGPLAERGKAVAKAGDGAETPGAAGRGETQR
ncbi:MAG TPA: lysoplasmalogenase [Gemmatales bacterium]|nr:lysoplasmalogenase [Gemmatales bacterium]